MSANAVLQYMDETGRQADFKVPTDFADMATVTITTIATVWTPTSGKTVRLLGGSLSVSAAISVLFEDNALAGGTIWRTPVLVANTPYYFDLGGEGYLLSAVDNLVKATGSAAGTIIGTLYGREE